jgi:HEAT repeat protein
MEANRLFHYFVLGLLLVLVGALKAAAPPGDRPITGTLPQYAPAEPTLPVPLGSTRPEDGGLYLAGPYMMYHSTESLRGPTEAASAPTETRALDVTQLTGEESSQPGFRRSGPKSASHETTALQALNEADDWMARWIAAAPFASPATSAVMPGFPVFASSAPPTGTRVLPLEPGQYVGSMTCEMVAQMLRDSLVASERVIVSDVLIQGSSQWPAEIIKNQMRTRAGKEYVADVLQEDIRTLFANRTFANVWANTQEDGAGRVKVTVYLHDFLSKVQKVSYQGNHNLSKDDLEELTRIRQGMPLNPTANKLDCDRIVRRYHEDGWPFASCDLIKGDQEGDTEVIFNITEGPRVKTRATDFTGNTFVSSAVLRNHIRNWTGNTFVDDEEKLVRYYKSFGFHNVKVSREMVSSADGKEVTLIFHIQEGIRYRIADTPQITGVTSVPIEELAILGKAKAGEFYSVATIQGDAKRMTDWISYTGREVVFQPTEVYDENEPGLVRINLEVEDSRSTKNSSQVNTEKGGPSIADLVKRLEADNVVSRSDAAGELGKLGPKAEVAIPALIRTLKSREPLTRLYTGGSHTGFDFAPAEAREALVQIGPVAIPALTAALKHSDALTRVNAAWALWKLQGRAEVVIPVLVRAWKDKALFAADECIRRSASDALGEIGREQPATVLPILLKGLEDADEDMVCGSVRSLGVARAEGDGVILALVRLLPDRRTGVFQHAAFRLREIGPAAVPQLLAALKDADPQLRQGAACALAGMEGRHAKVALPALRKAARDTHKEVRERATWAIEMIEGEK